MFEVQDEVHNHISICKKVLDVLFKYDAMDDYMDLSSASEDDVDYAEFEEAEKQDASSGTASPDKRSPSKQTVENTIQIDENSSSANNLCKIKEIDLAACDKLVSFLMERCQTISIQHDFK